MSEWQSWIPRLKLKSEVARLPLENIKTKAFGYAFSGDAGAVVSPRVVSGRVPDVVLVSLVSVGSVLEGEALPPPAKWLLGSLAERLAAQRDGVSLCDVNFAILGILLTFQSIIC